MPTTTFATTSAPLRLGVLDVGVLQLSIHLAPRVEALGYHRYWLSEHHGEGAISNPTILVPVIAGLTSTIRVGTAAVLLRFQSALAVAENFRAISQLFGGRIDVGLGRGGTSPATARALNDGRPEEYTAAAHAEKVAEVQRLLFGAPPADHPLASDRIDPPVVRTGRPHLWVASSSSDGARVAANLGAHYTFSDLFNWRAGPDAVQQYVDRFNPSQELAHPAWNVCVAGYCAENDDDEKAMASKYFANPPPERRVFVGTMSKWRDHLASVADAYQTDEIIVQTLNRRYDLERQVDSFARIAEVARSLGNVCSPHARASSAA